jgi:formylglycine-generating enzyme required for sulfatase activity
VYGSANEAGAGSAVRALAIIFCALSICWATAASAEKRVALVVGVDRYDNLAADKQLKKAVNDARAVAAALKALGFETDLGENVTRREFFRLWTRFTERLSPGDVAAFFFAGHGVDLDGNYLVPRDVQGLEGETTLKADSIAFRELLADLRSRRLQVSFEILDACRDNPFQDAKGRALGGTRGLGRPDNPEGNFIMYSAGERQTALDRLSEDDRDPNSIFTRSLLPLLSPQAGLSLDDIAKKVRARVRELARGVGHQQFLAYYNELTEDFYLSAAKPPEPQASKPPAEAPKADASEAARAAWADIKDKTDPRLFEAYRQQFGKANPYYDALAERRIAELTPAQVVVKTPKPSAKPTEDACDGLLVSVAMSEKPCIKPGSGASFKDCADCPEMVVAPSGSFNMGSPSDEPERESWQKGTESPQHKVTIANPFAVGKFAVTFAEWDACANDGGCGGAKPSDQGWGRGDRPVINVNWNEAKDYIGWLSKKTGKTYRLLSEAEREYVTRAGTATPFWWGRSITPALANYDGSAEPYKGGGSKGEYRHKTLPVKSFKPNPWGLYQVHGNVWEWVEDCWHDSYNGAPSDGSAWTSVDCSRRVLRGGSWGIDPGILRAARRDWGTPVDRGGDIGFRLARTLNPIP